jgi:CheY-like chemotaxis protein
MPKDMHILLVEDNPGDVLLTQEALKESAVKNRLSVVRDGAEALDYINKLGAYAHAPEPDLILLDLNLPKVNGHEVLERIKTNARWKAIPVIMLTTSQAESDVQRAYNAHANCYITKPTGFGPFVELISGVEQYWTRLVTLPGRLKPS